MTSRQRKWSARVAMVSTLTGLLACGGTEPAPRDQDAREAGAETAAEVAPPVDAAARPDLPPEPGADARDAADRGGEAGAAPDGGTVVSSALPREIIAAPGAEVAMVTLGNTQFMLELLARMRAASPDSNLFFSPLSISTALAMTYAGARGATATEMKDALLFRIDGAELHRGFNALDQELARRMADAGPMGSGDPFKLTIANALWGRAGEPFLPAFLDVLAQNYGAGLRVLDFAADPELARVTINRHVEGATEGRIKDLIMPGKIRADTILVLTNAIYFRASWREPFAVANTAARPFTLLDGTTASVPTMQKQESLLYAEIAGVQMVEIPYLGNKLSLLVMAPRAGQLASFEANLVTSTFLSSIANLQPTEVLLDLPKFSFRAPTSLKTVLQARGMRLAFENNADFSGMNGRGGILISDVVHEAFIGLDEKGTEAAAATAVIAPPPSGPPPATPVKIDRPFYFFVRDKPTGAILFAGRLLDPR